MELNGLSKELDWNPLLSLSTLGFKRVLTKGVFLWGKAINRKKRESGVASVASSFNRDGR